MTDVGFGAALYFLRCMRLEHDPICSDSRNSWLSFGILKTDLVVVEFDGNVFWKSVGALDFNDFLDCT